MTDECVCLESSVLPVIATVPLSIEYHSIDGTICIDILPFTGEDTAVTWLRVRRLSGEIHRNRLMNRRLSASHCEQRKGK
jgi:hypothetical protein